ncbi:NADP-dependent malic enzyme [Roseococcus pinisoli]|uniref:NADP-dependent malic enzyme n=1 Tax=Roseococcus pinisoli TaxID=2835040 RepID=A0ABS5QA26_9PROT|nr:NADP-dependent malic enzyme [Roseococcus pinisoli]MBS7810561.1 NADP-dependent malic enzyme [Roseococcus pinisoli]
MDDVRKDGLTDTRTARITGEEALAMHAEGRPGKLEIRLTKPLVTARDLSLAYSPGVAEPCLHIHRNPALAYDYTSKGNFVAVVSNGTAVLGLGNLGALASKPVMEGKVALFKRFADVDGIDLCLDTEDVDAFVNSVRYLGPSFGGINLEDIKAPECFIIESRLRELMDIPVFHDDQHGTAIVAAAGLINAAHLTGRDLKTTKLVINGAGAAAIACAELLKAMGMTPQNVILCDTKGVVYRGRTEGMNQWKSAHAIDTDRRTLSQALEGADCFFGLSAKGALTAEMIRAMAPAPIIFAMANPDPEITPDEARAARPDCIIATGRSDYPNQVNNVLGFPFIFRGALDVRASTINDAMKIAAAQSLAELAREAVPEEVARSGAGKQLVFGPEYIIPNAFDPRLISRVPVAVAEAAVRSGVARKPIIDTQRYSRELASRLDVAANALEAIHERVRENPKRVVFAEGEDETVIRAAINFRNAGYGYPVLVGREERINATVAALGVRLPDGIEIHNARLSSQNRRYAEWLYARKQRDGFLFRDCQRLVNQDRNVFAACMLAMGDADALITGETRSYSATLEGLNMALDHEGVLFGLSMMIARRSGTVLVADTAIHERPDAATLAEIATRSAATARRLGLTPRVAFLSFSTFGDPKGSIPGSIREAVKLLDGAGVDFEYDGEMGADVALDAHLRASLYPFCRLTGPANVLVMPGLHAAHILTKAVPHLTSATTIGPILMGLRKSAQIVPTGAGVNQLLDMAALAAYQAIEK